MKFRKLSIIYALSDFLASAVAWTFFYFLLNDFDFRDLSARLPETDYLIGLIVIPVCWVFLFMMTGFYVVSLKRSRLAELIYSLSVTIPGVFLQFFILLFQGFITDNSLSLYFLETLFIFQFILTYIPRVIITSSTAGKVHKGLIGYNTLIVGSNGKAIDLFNRIKNEKIPGGNFLIGYVSISDEKNGLLKNYIPHLGQIENLPQIISDHKVEEVIIAIEGNEFDTIEEIIGFLNFSDVTIKAIPSLKDILTGRVKHTAIFGTPLLEISNLLMPVWQANIKQMMDYILAVFFLIVLSPLMLLLAILIRFSGEGAVIYSQERVGKNGKPFIIFKFRSMLAGAENDQPLLSDKNDIRITAIGRFMRKHRLDEIPNLVNVVRGEMSLVGPRPERRFFIDQIVKTAPHYRRLHKVKPGITSWGQVKYGYASDVNSMIERLEYDLLYLENMSLSIDLKIIIYTVIIILKGKGV
ncbi:MAG: sugar transferase [Odoribacter sp.]|nr:sugar transferase [Odoribacter sp.]